MNPSNQRVLALLPHPDDIEILCAGTLCLLQERGFELHVATMTAGDKGSATLAGPEISRVRRAEAQSAADAMGARSYNCLEFEDLEISFDSPSRHKVAGFLRDINPFLVFTTAPRDYMFDHEITSHLVRDACFNASAPNYPADGNAPPSSGVPYLYYCDPVGGHDIVGAAAPNSVIVDISTQIERKARALSCHESQRAWLQTQHGMDNYVETMKEWDTQRGRTIGVAYAEAFCQHLGHPHPEDDFLRAQLAPGAVALSA